MKENMRFLDNCGEPSTVCTRNMMSLGMTNMGRFVCDRYPVVQLEIGQSPIVRFENNKCLFLGKQFSI